MALEKIYKFYSYTRSHGLGKAVAKTRAYVGKKAHVYQQPIDVMADVEDIIEADFVAHPYVAPPALAREKLKVAWVLSAMSRGSGGQSTITRFARYLSQQGHDVTIYIYESIQPQSVAEARRILAEDFHFNVTVRKIADYQESDALIATGWETAYPVFNIKTRAHKFYFVQDFEPLFYGMGSKSVLAENTYRMNFYGITAGRWLSTRLASEYGMATDYFDFGVDLDVYRPAHIPAKKNKIVFYARPVTERRAFELGVIALDIFHRQHPDYEIECIGWDVSNYKLPFPYVNRGILTHEQLAALYAESKACLVLSLTNVSLLPLELIAAGCLPVMNEGDNNTMVLGQNDFITYAPAVPSQLADALHQVVTNADQSVYARASDSVTSASWERSYEKVETVLLREVTGGGR